MKYILLLLASMTVFAGNTGTTIDADYNSKAKFFRNYIKNFGAEKNVANVAGTNVTLSRNTTTPLEGEGDFSFTIDSATDVVEWSANAFDLKLKNSAVCEAKLVYTADANATNVQMQVYRNAQVIGSKNLQSSSDPVSATILFPCGDLSALTSIRLVGTAATSTVMKVDSVYLGEHAFTTANLGGQWVGRVTMAGAAGCTFAVTSATYANVSPNASCNSPVSSGAVQTAGKIIGLTIPNVSPNYNYVFKLGGVYMGQSTNTDGCQFRISDGVDTSDSAQLVYNTGTSISATGQLEASVNPTSSGSKTYQLQIRYPFGIKGCELQVSSSLTAQLDVYRYPKIGDVNVDLLDGSQASYGGVNFSGSANYQRTTAGWVTATNATWATGRTYFGTAVVGASANDYSFKMPFVKAGVYEVCTSAYARSISGSIVYASIYDGTNRIALTQADSNLASAQDHNKIGCGIVKYDTDQTNITYQVQATCTSGSNCFIFAQNSGGANEFSSLYIKPYPGNQSPLASVNLTGEPGSWSGYHSGADCRFDLTGATLTTFNTDSTCTFAEKINNNFGIVSSYLVTGNKYPGITFTPKVTGVYEICAFTNAVANAGNASELSLTDGVTEIVKIPVRTGSYGYNQSGCGLYSATTGTTTNIRLNGRADGADTLSIGPNTGLPTRNGNAIEWTIKPVTQNLPGLLGGGGNVYSNSGSQERIERAYFTNTGSCAVASQSGSWITGVSDPGIGRCGFTIASGVFSANPVCTVTAVDASAAATARFANNIITTTAGEVDTYNTANALTDYSFYIICMGPKGSL